MADEQALMVMRTALEGFDTPHLQKLIVAAYDRWNWETGTDADKDWYEIAEQILAERGIATMPNINQPNNIVFSFANSGTQVDVLTMDGTGDLVLGTKQSLKLKNNTNSGIQMEHELLEADAQGNLEIGFDLKVALVSFIAQELNAGSVSSNGGQNLGQIFEDKVAQTIRNRI